MNSVFEQTILNITNASAFHEVEMIQELWSGYGKIVRLKLEGSDLKTIVAKQVRFPLSKNRNSEFSHLRKVKSYEVEPIFYKNFSQRTNDLCRVPKYLASAREGGEVLLLLEDLNTSGFDKRKSSVNWQEFKYCIEWLANFHAVNLGVNAQDLWEIGTYWHLDTRPEELEVLNDLSLKNAAKKIDRILNNCKFKTLVHGDAKLANFCFSATAVAAVDFQYVGSGCGMKDLAYFVGSCFGDADSEKFEQEILNSYFKELKKALKDSSISFEALENEWREMYPIAWADFHRFVKGWSPGHWKINSYSEKITKKVISELSVC
jgi:hypothetical protein